MLKQVDLGQIHTEFVFRLLSNVNCYVQLYSVFVIVWLSYRLSIAFMPYGCCHPFKYVGLKCVISLKINNLVDKSSKNYWNVCSWNKIMCDWSKQKSLVDFYKKYKWNKYPTTIWTESHNFFIYFLNLISGKASKWENYILVPGTTKLTTSRIIVELSYVVFKNGHLLSTHASHIIYIIKKCRSVYFLFLFLISELS